MTNLNKSKIGKTYSGKHNLFFIFEPPEFYHSIVDTKISPWAQFELRKYVIHNIRAKFDKPVKINIPYFNF